MNILEVCSELMKDDEKVFEAVSSGGSTHVLKTTLGSIIHICGGTDNTELAINQTTMELDFKLQIKPVPFMEAYNNGKQIEPVEYFNDSDRVDLLSAIERDSNMSTALFMWLGEDVRKSDEPKYINGLWIIKE